eukprot:1125408-Amphidinium_carterae.1
MQLTKVSRGAGGKARLGEKQQQEEEQQGMVGKRHKAKAHQAMSRNVWTPVRGGSCSPRVMSSNIRSARQRRRPTGRTHGGIAIDSVMCVVDLTTK